MKKYAQYVDFLHEMCYPNSVYRAIIWYLEDWIWRQDNVTVYAGKAISFDGYIVEVTTVYDNCWHFESIKMYEEDGNFIFEKKSSGRKKDEDLKWYSTDENFGWFSVVAPMKVSIPVKSSGYRVFAKFMKEYCETHK